MWRRQLDKYYSTECRYFRVSLKKEKVTDVTTETLSQTSVIHWHKPQSFIGKQGDNATSRLLIYLPRVDRKYRKLGASRG